MMSSVLGKFGVPGYTAYCAAKTGLIGFSRALALELAPRKITVNALCPGWVDTAMARSGMRDIAAAQGISVEEFKRQALSRVPLGEMVKPEEVANLVVFLASDAGKNITAQAISICGQSLDALRNRLAAAAQTRQPPPDAGVGKAAEELKRANNSPSLWKLHADSLVTLLEIGSKATENSERVCTLASQRGHRQQVEEIQTSLKKLHDYSGIAESTLTGSVEAKSAAVGAD